MEDKSINEKKINEVISKCKNKLDMSYFKYGEARKNYAGGRVDAINYILLRILFPLHGDYYTETDSSESAGIDIVPINME